MLRTSPVSVTSSAMLRRFSQHTSSSSSITAATTLFVSCNAATSTTRNFSSSAFPAGTKTAASYSSSSGFIKSKGYQQHQTQSSFGRTSSSPTTTTATMFEPRRYDASGNNEDVNVAGESLDSDEFDDDSVSPQTTITLGILLTAAGIIIINLNERRAAKQDDLDETIEPLVVSLTDSPKDPKKAVKFNSAQDLDGLIFHAFGDVDATQPYPHDPDLHVEVPKALRLSRKVEMYQYVEHKETHTDKNGKSHTSYSYTKEWSSSHERTRDNRNPSFPKFSPIREAESLDMSIENRPKSNFDDELFDDENNSSKQRKIKLHLSSDYVQRIQDYEEVQPIQTYDDNRALRQHQYELVENDSVLFRGKSGSSLHHPAIGDEKITYRYVPPGEYTSLGYYSKKKGMEPVRGKLKETLAKSHGELIIPEKAHEMLNKTAKYGTSELFDELKLTNKQEVTDEKTGEKSLSSRLALPEWLISPLETAMLSITPIEFAFLQREHATKKEAIEHNRDNQAKSTSKWFYGGLLMCGLGGAAVGGAMATVLPSTIGGYTTVGGFGTGLVIGRQTREGSREQLEQYRIKQMEGKNVIKATPSKKEKGVFEL